MNRRSFLKNLSATAPSAGLLSGCSVTGHTPVATSAPFQHGVASGDPLSDRVILWTRVTGLGAVEVFWWVATNPVGDQPVARGSQITNAERDFTVKVDAAGLKSDQTYFYGFTAAEIASPVGRTRTLPVGRVSSVSLAVTSCANHPQGFFNAYGHIAQRRDINVVLSLGDYLYEYPNSDYGDGRALGRVPVPNAEIVSLADYRVRHAQYKQDPDLLAAHQAHPWICIWDDHESANNSWTDGAQNHSPETEGSWAVRKAVAIRAYYEWMPIREVPTGLYRSFRFGNLADLVMLDTRLEGRDEQGSGEDLATANDPDRTLLGPVQEARFLSHLKSLQETGVRWKVVGQQVVFAPWSDGKSPFNPDSWDGYRASRNAVLDHITTHNVENTVILTGDVHSAWGMEVPDASGVRRAVEFVAPAVSSPPLATNSPALRQLVEQAPKVASHIKFADGDHNGYLVLQLDDQAAEASWWFTGERTARNADAFLAQRLACMSGVSELSE
ncbi:MAG: alkaline phosphatase D family protein [Pseudomonadota bacterium]